MSDKEREEDNEAQAHDAPKDANSGKAKLSIGGEKILKAVSKLVVDVNGIIFALNTLDEVMQARLTEVSEQIISFFDDNKGEIISRKKKKGYEIEIPIRLSGKIGGIIKNKSIIDTGSAALKQAILLAIVSHWDSFVSSILDAIFEMNPGIVDASGRSLTYSDLRQYPTIEAARTFIVESEIESVVRENHAHHFDYIAKKTNISLKPRDKAWHIFLEMTERRNLVAHTGGIASRSYLNNCAKYGIKLPDDVTIGKRLEIDKAYLVAACDWTALKTAGLCG